LASQAQFYVGRGTYDPPRWPLGSAMGQGRDQFSRERTTSPNSSALGSPMWFSHRPSIATEREGQRLPFSTNGARDPERVAPARTAGVLAKGSM
jgi:hypothetical protein